MDDLYDEFGNFIGEAVSSDEAEQEGDAGSSYVYDEDSEPGDEPNDQALMEIDEDGPSKAVILHGCKQDYPTAQQVYGPYVETMVQEYGDQPLTQPVIAPVAQKKFQVQETDLPPVFYSREF